MFPNVRVRRMILPAVALLASASVAVAERGNGSPAPAVRAMDGHGSLSIVNSRGEGAILSASGLAPGGSVSGEVTIRNSGTVSGGFTLSGTDVVDTPGIGGGLLSQRLQLVVLDLTTPTTVYSGALNGLASRDLGTIGPGQARTYRFTATLPDGGTPPTPIGGDNAYQNARVVSTYLWTATSLDETGGGGSGGDGGGGTGGGPANGGGPVGGGGPGQGTPLRLKVGLPRKQPPLKKRKLIVNVRCDAACSVTATGKIARNGKVRGKAKAAANRTVKLALRLSKTSVKKLTRALRSKRGTKMTLAVVARDGAGRSASFKRPVTLKRGRKAGGPKVTVAWQKAGRR
jgi:hypothetical protein